MTEPRNRSVIVFWIVGIVALLWNGIGCVNLYQQLLGAGAEGLPEKYRTYVLQRPEWATLAFALSVIAGVIGAVLFLRRQQLAAPAFWASCFGAAVVVLSALGSGATGVLIPSGLSVLVAAIFALVARSSIAR